ACPPEECGGPAGYLTRRDEARGLEAYQDASLIAETAQEVVDGTVPSALTDPLERAGFEEAVSRGADIERAPNHAKRTYQEHPGGLKGW
ncbi:MAG: plasmid pRiA4b ORF-3 family protein, partial [Bauldia litoralis]